MRWRHAGLPDSIAGAVIPNDSLLPSIYTINDVITFIPLNIPNYVKLLSIVADAHSLLGEWVIGS